MTSGRVRQDVTRREFLRGAARGAAVAGLAAGAVAMLRRAPASANTRCTGFTCRGCPILATCPLDPAGDERSASRG